MHSTVVFLTCHPLFNLTVKEQTFPTQIKGPLRHCTCDNDAVVLYNLISYLEGLVEMFWIEMHYMTSLLWSVDTFQANMF